jgi:hypothetical protein
MSPSVRLGAEKIPTIIKATAIAKRQELSPGAGDTVCAVTLTFMPPLC